MPGRRTSPSPTRSESSTESHDIEPDGPRVAQWMDDEELDGDEESLPSNDDDPSSDLETVKKDISKLPLGALVKAQRTIISQHESDEDGDEDEDEDGSDSSYESEAPATTSGPSTKKQIQHRANKHAPMEITSKKPVPRRRQVVEIHKIQARDPRFSDLSGTLSENRFRSQYSFLSELHVGELSTLKQSLARARKLLLSSPRHLREEREAEVKKLELSVKRVESVVEREKREDVEQKALERVRREEKDKRRAGKKTWWLKDADKKALRVRARLDALEQSGGKRAVKKAIEKKQRKIGQKEKKRRPHAATGKRRREDETENRTKRRRIHENESI